MTSRDDADARHWAEEGKSPFKSTITTLRDKLEKRRIGEEDRIQQAIAGANDENKQLKATITVLRDELERGLRNT